MEIGVQTCDGRVCLEFFPQRNDDNWRGCGTDRTKTEPHEPNKTEKGNLKAILIFANQRYVNAYR